eukprot:3933996-Rhodomonas_salina.3
MTRRVAQITLFKATQEASLAQCIHCSTTRGPSRENLAADGLHLASTEPGPWGALTIAKIFQPEVSNNLKLEKLAGVDHRHFTLNPASEPIRKPGTIIVYVSALAKYAYWGTRLTNQGWFGLLCQGAHQILRQ